MTLRTFSTVRPQLSKRRVIWGDRKVAFIGKMGLVFHSTTDVKGTLDNVYFLHGLGFNLFSPHCEVSFRLERYVYVKWFAPITQERNWIISSSAKVAARNVDTTNYCYACSV